VVMLGEGCRSGLVPRAPCTTVMIATEMPAAIKAVFDGGSSLLVSKKPLNQVRICVRPSAALCFHERQKLQPSTLGSAEGIS